MSDPFHPTLCTPRLRLRPLRHGDLGPLVELAGDRRIADTMISVPHPFTLEEAGRWLERVREQVRSGLAVRCALELPGVTHLIGSCELRDIDREHAQAELSLWIGVPWWGRGFATEAAAALLGHGFAALGLNRVYAHYMVRNPASGRVLEKLGLAREGVLRQRVRKWGVFEDVVLCAILRAEWPGVSPH